MKVNKKKDAEIDLSSPVVLHVEDLQRLDEIAKMADLHLKIDLDDARDIKSEDFDKVKDALGSDSFTSAYIYMLGPNKSYSYPVTIRVSGYGNSVEFNLEGLDAAGLRSLISEVFDKNVSGLGIKRGSMILYWLLSIVSVVLMKESNLAILAAIMCTYMMLVKAGILHSKSKIRFRKKRPIFKSLINWFKVHSDKILPGCVVAIFSAFLTYIFIK